MNRAALFHIAHTLDHGRATHVRCKATLQRVRELSITRVQRLVVVAVAGVACDYPKCTTLDLRNELTSGLHASDDPVLRQEVRHIWQAQLERSHLPWPALASE